MGAGVVTAVNAATLDVEPDDWWPYDDELSLEDDQILRRIECQLLEQVGEGPMGDCRTLPRCHPELEEGDGI
jgi:hypothetical protein